VKKSWYTLKHFIFHNLEKSKDKIRKFTYSTIMQHEIHSLPLNSKEVHDVIDCINVISTALLPAAHMYETKCASGKVAGVERSEW